MFKLFSGRHIGELRRSSHIRLYNFALSISTNISTLLQHTHLKLGELPFFIYRQYYHNFLTLSTAWFLIIFLLRDNEHTVYAVKTFYDLCRTLKIVVIFIAAFSK